MRSNRKWEIPRWRPVNFNCVFLRSQTRYRRNSNGYTHVFGVQHSNGTSSDTVRPNRKWVIQDVSLKTSNACISVSRQDINEIPTAMPMFSGSSSPMRLTRRLCDQTGSGKFQDGSRLTLIACFSAPRQDIDEISTATPMFLGSKIPTRLVQILCNQTASE